MRSISHWGLYEDFDREILLADQLPPEKICKSFGELMAYLNDEKPEPILQKLNFGHLD